MVAQKNTDSFAWKSICSVGEVFKSGIENGEADRSHLKWKHGETGEYLPINNIPNRKTNSKTERICE